MAGESIINVGPDSRCRAGAEINFLTSSLTHGFLDLDKRSTRKELSGPLNVDEVSSSASDILYSKPFISSHLGVFVLAEGIDSITQSLSPDLVNKRPSEIDEQTVPQVDLDKMYHTSTSERPKAPQHSSVEYNTWGILPTIIDMCPADCIEDLNSTQVRNLRTHPFN